MQGVEKLPQAVTGREASGQLGHVGPATAFLDMDANVQFHRGIVSIVARPDGSTPSDRLTPNTGANRSISASPGTRTAHSGLGSARQSPWNCSSRGAHRNRTGVNGFAGRDRPALVGLFKRFSCHGCQPGCQRRALTKRDSSLKQPPGVGISWQPHPVRGDDLEPESSEPKGSGERPGPIRQPTTEGPRSADQQSDSSHSDHDAYANPVTTQAEAVSPEAIVDVLLK